VATLTAEQFEFMLPDLAEGMAEAEIVQWIVKDGDSVNADQPMLEVLTDKATVELTSPRKGTIVKILWKAGDVVPVGSPLVVIELAPGETKPESKGHKSMAAAVAGAAAPAPKAAAPAPAPAPAAPAAPAPAPVAAEVTRTGKALATPATRKFAREQGIDIQQVPGSGPAGRVTKEDVERFTQGGAAPAATAAAAPGTNGTAYAGREERIPLKGLRKVIAERMHASKTTVAHVTQVDEADLTELVKLRAKMKPAAEAQGIKLTYLPFIVKAVIATLKKFPMLNASLDDATKELVIKHYYNIGIAVDTENGLVVPVIHDADRKSIFQIAKEITELAGKARAGKNSLDELKGGTFSLTNIGSVGGLFATPVVNHPEVGIFAVNKLQKRPVVINDEIVIRDMMYTAISFDHRVVDGALAAHFLNTLGSYLSDPTLLFMEMA
jgi:pyruvate dehydrogenase E2 component (dihydrolipoamide acetyltransferase)